MICHFVFKAPETCEKCPLQLPGVYKDIFTLLFG